MTRLTPVNAVLVVGLSVLSCSRAAVASKPLTISWDFSGIHRTSEGVPRGPVYLRVNGKEYLVDKDPDMSFRVLSPDEYSAFDASPHALTAASGWFAGEGENFYVIRRGRRLRVYCQGVDETTPEQPYRRILTIKL